jgi:hypothetical protein
MEERHKREDVLFILGAVEPKWQLAPHSFQGPNLQGVPSSSDLYRCYWQACTNVFHQASSCEMSLCPMCEAITAM